MSQPCVSCANDRPEMGIYLFWQESDIITRIERLCPACMREYQGRRVLDRLVRAGGAGPADLALLRAQTRLVC